MNDYGFGNFKLRTEKGLFPSPFPPSPPHGAVFSYKIFLLAHIAHRRKI